MKKKIFVISLGGSLIIPNRINYKYLKNFKRTLLKYSGMYKFIIVCGGGNIARKYIGVLKKECLSTELQSYAGISSTRTNARFVSYFFNINQKGIPHTLKTLKKQIKKQPIVFCGALDYKPEQTSDTTATLIARELKTEFVNLTNVSGLYDKDPNMYENSKLIEKISWKDFYKKAKKIKYSPGQHFILDQKSSRIILEEKIPCHIIGNKIKELNNFLEGKKFKGTTIKG